MRKTEVKVGDRFASWEVIGLLGHRKIYNHSRLILKIRCDCGFINELPEHSFKVRYNKNPNNYSCAKCAGRNQRICSKGDIFDKLTVIGYTSNLSKKLVVCKCVCGDEVKIRAESLFKNKTNSCGCYPNGAYKGYKEISGICFYRIKRNASIRNLEIDLTIEYLWDLFELQNKKCAMTGQKITFKPQTASLDRIDNTKGYLVGNVQWLHKDINIMKLDHSMDEFINLCRMVVEHNETKSI